MAPEVPSFPRYGTIYWGERRNARADRYRDSIVVLVIIGIVLWAVHTFIPMDKNIRTILDVVVVLFVLIWLAHVFGIGHYLKRMP